MFQALITGKLCLKRKKKYKVKNYLEGLNLEHDEKEEILILSYLFYFDNWNPILE